MDRWRPQRAGLLNVWRFEDEVFAFHRGRLLLRGPNGSGKSMALELLFPFLLDANTSPHRLSSATKSRGGLYDRIITGVDGPSRVGFLWCELGNGEETFTIGVRLRVSTNHRRVDSDWFTTTLVVGDTFHLLDETRTPLSRQALAEAIGASGAVHTSTDEYRRAVRTRLFPGFSPEQYDAAIDTLLTLRREKISQDLTPSTLSNILSDSLPSLDQYDLAEVAEGFERLDRRRAALAELEGDVAEVRTLARSHARYARAVVASVAGEVKAAENERDAANRRVREAEAALDAATGERAEAAAEDEAADARSKALAAEIDTLKNLDAYRAGAQIQALRDEAGRARERAEHDERAAERAALEQAERAATVASREQALAASADHERRARIDIDAAADRVRAAGVVAEAASQEPDSASVTLTAWVDARRTELKQVRAALAALDRAVTERGVEERAVERDRGEVDRGAEAAAAAAATVDQAVEAFRADAIAWVRGCTALDPERLLAALPTPLDDGAALAAAVAEVAAAEMAALAADRARAQDAVAALDDERAGLEAERAELAAGRTPVPEAPTWRASRDARDGAPLWRVVDVAPGTDADVLGAVEAALVASGLLDAWVAPDGRIALPDGLADVLADAAIDGHREGAGSLADVLVPLPDTAVDAAVVTAVLRSVALADTALASGGRAVVGRDGTFRLGVLAGRGAVGPAGFLGAAAQEQRRQRRIAAIDEELGRVAHERAAVEHRLADIDRRRAAVGAEAASCPDGGAVTAASRALALAEQSLADARSRLERSAAALHEAEGKVRGAQRALMAAASTAGLPTDDDALEEYAERLRTFERAVTTWERRRRDAARAITDLERARAELSGAEERARAAETDARAARQRAGELAARLEALEASAGAEYREVVARIEAAARQVDELDGRRVQLRGRLSELDKIIGGQTTALEAARERRADIDGRRAGAHAALVALVADGLVADAGLPEPDRIDGVGAIVDTARALVDAAGTPPDDAALSKAQHNAQEAVHSARQALGSRVDVTFEQAERGWWLLRTASAGLRRSVGELASALAADLDRARAELRDEEHRLFEETLAGTVRQAVTDRIRLATRLVDAINAELTKVRTDAAGVSVRLRWEVDPEQPDDVRAARRLLLKDPADHTAEERESLYAFFRARLEAARAALDATAGWETRLREALDYRKWHRFSLEIAHRDWEGLVPATTARLARLSTGERSIALHLPMLASVAAHYDGSGESVCPRLILLDELFAGVDTANRAQLFGMFSTWDLDAVFTSDHEWCTYPTLDGIAIHHLHPAGQGEPVTTSRFVWDGRERRAAPLEAVG